MYSAQETREKHFNATDTVRRHSSDAQRGPARRGGCTLTLASSPVAAFSFSDAGNAAGVDDALNVSRNAWAVKNVDTGEEQDKRQSKDSLVTPGTSEEVCPTHNSARDVFIPRQRVSSYPRSSVQTQKPRIDLKHLHWCPL